MARVHTLLYNSPDLASLDLQEYLKDLATEIAEAFGAEERGIRTEIDIEPMAVPLDTAVPLAFIAVELLTNAFKHAFPPGRTGSIRVAAARSGADGVLAISDDGVGLSGKASAGRSLGLTIVGKLVQQIGGRLERTSDGAQAFGSCSPWPRSPARGRATKAGWPAEGSPLDAVA
jgi:two-component sensor histidine kinase